MISTLGRALKGLGGLCVLILGLHLACGNSGSSGSGSGGSSATAPSITGQPASQTVTAGQPAAFTVTATGTAPFTYQWKKDGTALPGATAATFSLAAAQASDAGSYAVIVTNAGGSVPSSAATLTVNVAPSITGQPASQTVTAGQPASFSVTASGTAPFTYQWKKDGTAIPGATSATFAIATAQPSDAGSYAVVVTNAAGSVPSSAATLTVNVAPTITGQPANQTVTAGQPASFSVTASGTAPFTYQWQKNGTAIPGATSATLAIATAQPSDAGSYAVVVTNAAGSVPSSAATLTVNVAPTITGQPANQTVTAGQPASFSVTASGTAPFTYQWQKNGVAIPGATAATYSLAAAQLADAGSYTVSVSNVAGGAASSAATLTVNPAPVAPSITGQPADLTVTEGQPASFSVTATGTAPLAYQWRKDGADLPGATAATYNLAAAQATDAGTYTVLVSNGVGTTPSAPAVLTVNAALAITVQPQSPTVTAPDAATFSVQTSAAHPTYQWKRNGVAIAGATAATYTVPGTTDLQTVPDTYTVVVSEGGASVESVSATFTVVAPAPTYPAGGEPVPVAPRALTVLPSLHVDAVKFPQGAFRLGYDEGLKNPVWTAYADFRVNTPYPNSSGDYQTDTRLAAPQVTKGSMGTHGGAGFFLANGQGFDRGHMVTRSDVSYRYGSQAGDDATYMSNLIPQVSYYNQRLWNDLEEAVGGKTSGGSFTNGLTATFGRVWIYSGPIFTGTTSYWVPSTETYTTNPGALPAGTLAIAIPRACYKIVVAEPASGQTLPRVMAWISSNRSYATAESADLWKYVTSVKRVEDLTGLDFFPNLPHDASLTAWKAAVDVRGWGTAFEKATGPNAHVLQPSWDLIPIAGNPVLTGDTVATGALVPFEAAVAPNAAGGTVDGATATWTFGDGGTATGLSTTHAFATTGDFTVTFTATDSLGQSTALTRTVHVLGASGNQPPTVTPTTLPSVTATLGQAIPPATFTVSDDATAAGALTVTATSSDQTLIADGSLIATNTNGQVSLTLTPNPGQTGAATITVTVADEDGALTVKTFTLTIAANTPPTFTPSTLPNASTSMGVPKQVTFTLADDQTPAGALTVTATSNNPTLLPDANVALANASGAITLTLTPAAGQTGTATITVVATDGDGLATTKTFDLQVSAAGTGPVLIISQYYAGTSNNKWIEITNVGDATYDAAVKPAYLGQWNNPRTTNKHYALAITGTLAPGATMLVRNNLATVPAYAYNGGGAATADGVRVQVDASNVVMGFNGNDVVYLTDRAPATATDTSAYDNRVDAIGDYTTAADQSAANWDPSPLPPPPAGFLATDQVGQYRSFLRLATVIAARKVFDPTEWSQVDSVRIAAATPSAVDSAAAGTTQRLGFHSFNP